MPDIPPGAYTGPPPIASIQIALHANGQVQYDAKGDALSIYNAIGTAMAHLAAHLKEKESKKIQVAPIGFANSLVN